MPADRLVIEPAERRPAVLDLIRGAQHRLALSMFRCDDFPVLDEIANARRRGVEVRLLLTQRARGWKKRLRDLAALIESMGVEIRRYGGTQFKYHAKYMLVDDGPALIASLNFTRKCFEKTCDFLAITHAPEIVSGLDRLFDADWSASGSPPPECFCDRLIVAPDESRSRLSVLLQQARHSLRIIDHKVKDPAMLALLDARRQDGVAVRTLGRGDLGALRAHGKLILADDNAAVIGSISLSTPSLDTRREVAVKITDPDCLIRLSEFFDGLAREE